MGASRCLFCVVCFLFCASVFCFVREVALFVLRTSCEHTTRMGGWVWKIMLVMRGERLPKVKGHTESCDCHTLIIITCKVRVVCVCIHRQDGDGAYNACGVC